MYVFLPLNVLPKLCDFVLRHTRGTRCNAQIKKQTAAVWPFIDLKTQNNGMKLRVDEESRACCRLKEMKQQIKPRRPIVGEITSEWNECNHLKGRVSETRSSDLYEIENRSKLSSEKTQIFIGCFKKTKWLSFFFFPFAVYFQFSSFSFLWGRRDVFEHLYWPRLRSQKYQCHLKCLFFYHEYLQIFSWLHFLHWELIFWG